VGTPANRGRSKPDTGLKNASVVIPGLPFARFLGAFDPIIGRLSGFLRPSHVASSPFRAQRDGQT
jgi:hypothetical protein